MADLSHEKIDKLTPIKIDSQPSEKCLKNEGIDHISNMPDAILCKILSHMPTKYALGTKILSTRWKNLSPFEVPPIKLDLDDDILLYPPRDNNIFSFMNFVDKLLSETLCDGPYVKSVESVFLRYSRWIGEFNEHEDKEKLDKENDEKIVAWVSAALRLNVINLNLVIPKMIDKNALLHTLNGCATLVELEIKGVEEDDLDLRLPGEFTLPNLKSLFLYSFFICDASINTLLGGCPVLNELSFSGCDFRYNLYVKSPLLKLFVIYNCTFWGEVVFDAPNIEVLAYQCASAYDIQDWVGADFKSLHSAYIEIDTDCDYDNLLSLAKIVNTCSNATRLCLSGYNITDLHTVSVHLSAFRNITWMAFGNMDNNGFELLACFLNSAPIVQTLTIGGLRFKQSGGYARFESLLPTLPVCLKLCLKKFEFLHFEGEEDEMKLVEYFLKNGRMLQEVTLHYFYCKDTNIFNRLFMFPKHSETCQILVKKYEDRYSHKNLLRRCLSFSSFYTKVSRALEWF